MVSPEQLAESLTKRERVNPLDMSPAESQPETDEQEKEEQIEAQPEEEVETPPSQTEEPSEESSEEEPKEEKSALEQSVPFHKHPRWIQQQTKFKELQSYVEELEGKLNKPQQEEAAQKAEELEEVPAHLRKVFGDDYEAYRAYQFDIEERARKLAEETYSSKVKAEQDARAKEEQEKSKLLAFYEESLTELGEEIGVPLHDPDNSVRNEILKLCADYGIVDGNGYPDFKKANELRSLLSEKEKKVSKERKKIAANAGAASMGDKPDMDTPDIYTPSKLRNTSLGKIINKF